MSINNKRLLAKMCLKKETEEICNVICCSFIATINYILIQRSFWIIQNFSYHPTNKKLYVTHAYDT